MIKLQKISEFMIENFKKLQENIQYPDDFVQQVYLDYSIENLKKNEQNQKFFIEKNTKNEIIALLYSGKHTQDQTIALVFWIFVEKRSIGKGLGKKLLGDCIDYYTKKGYTKIYSTAHKKNKSSIGLHEYFSFRVRSVTEDEVGYEKVL